MGGENYPPIMRDKLSFKRDGCMAFDVYMMLIKLPAGVLFIANVHAGDFLY